MNDQDVQSVEFNVDLPKPRPRNALRAIVLAVGAIAVIGAVIVFVISRTATPTPDPLAQVMPNTVAIYFSMTTHSDKQPNFQVIADAWKNSREANQLNSALELAVMQAGVNWDDDVRPWLGERVAVGLVDLGGYEAKTADQSVPAYRQPGVIAALQTIDRAKSDAFLAMVRKQIESQAKRDGATFTDEVYRGINLSYLNGDTAVIKVAYATFNDVIVIALGVDNLKLAVDAALDRTSLATREYYQKTMAALPGDNVGALYMDNAGYVEMTIKQAEQAQQLEPQTGEVFDNIYTSVYSHSNSTPDPNMQKEVEARQQAREAARRQQAEELQKLRDQLKTLGGGTGIVMTYEANGIRLESAAYATPNQATNAAFQGVTGQLTHGDGRILNSVPASTLLLMQGVMSKEQWQALLSPEYLAAQSINPSWQNLTNQLGKDIPTVLAEFEQQAGVDLKNDLLGLLDGEMALMILPKSTVSDASANDQSFGIPSFSVPFEVALVTDSPDAARIVSTFDKVFKAIETSSSGEVVWEGPGKDPYSTLLNIRGEVILTYGVVDGRFVIGSTADTLRTVDTADQNPITADPDFKDAGHYISGSQPATLFMKFSAIFDWYFNLLTGYSNFGGRPASCGPCNYMEPFKYLVTDADLKVGDVQLGSIFIKIEPAK